MYQDISANNKRIAKNTLLLYVRLLLTTVVGLYTSRVILDKLGVSDYGVFNVVGGIVTMMSFLNSAMVAASQRFLSYEIGAENNEKLKKVFNTAVSIHFLIAFIILILAETIGLWFVNSYLNIHADRMFAANCVYQTSILAFVISVITVPYNSCVISHERMNMFAYTSIVEVCLRLLICYLLGVVLFDKLITYGILLMLVTIIVSACYIIYCRVYFQESKLSLSYDKNVFKEMFSFAGWNLFGNLGSSFKDQIINVVINIFCGTAVNAARGVAIQVNGIVNTLASNVAMAINPQITKQYASGNIEQSRSLVYACAKYSFYFLTLIAIPFFLNIDTILGLWLVEVPTYTSAFLIIAITVSLIYTLSSSVSTAIQATGKVKVFQIGVCVIMLLEVPATYILLKFDFSPIVAILPTLITNSIALIYRFILINKYISSYTWKDYMYSVIFRCLLVFAISFAASYTFDKFTPSTFGGAILSMTISIIVVLFCIYTMGISKFERQVVLNIIKNKIKKHA